MKVRKWMNGKGAEAKERGWREGEGAGEREKRWKEWKGNEGKWQERKMGVRKWCLII